MRAIQVSDFKNPPVFNSDVPRPALPADNSGQVQIRVIATAIHNLVRSQSAGIHYTTTGKKVALPYIPGADGVGLTVPDNRLVYFVSIGTGGAFAEYINVSEFAVFPISGPNSTTPSTDRQSNDELAIKIATYMNPAISSWMALRTRTDVTTITKPGFTVLIMGVTSASGRIAIKLARSLGASAVIGVARKNSKMLWSDELNLDHRIGLEEEGEGGKDEKQQTGFAKFFEHNNIKVDVILDYIYGSATLNLLKSLPGSAMDTEAREVQYVQVGSLSGELDMNLPGAVLRSKNVSVRGSGPGAWTMKQMARETPQLLASFVDGVVFDDGDGSGSGKNKSLEDEMVERKLEKVDEAWNEKNRRNVFVVSKMDG